MENALCQALSLNTSSKSIHESDVSRIIKEFVRNPVLKEGSIFKRPDVINGCFGKDTVEEILFALIREGRKQTLRQCLIREFNISSHIVLRSFNYNDFYEWEPSKLEQVHDAIVMQFSEVVHDDRWGYLELPEREQLKRSKL
ncbi:hypothetical protein H5410_040808 [Solanum commersonii]|uniref:3-hydroxyisobutyryl-CoA hydrolase n=1 Tax=Solanum commersonii TaxID=4109 RepID=A0A9J5XTN2_SOLCO|nr:hypothetical protein H5410_040808 [Solanum commersonii]